MLTDVEIARGAKVAPITEVAKTLGLTPADLMLYGDDKAKIRADVITRVRSKPPGKLVLVSAITPTRAGEGKTTTTIGLGQALSKLGHRVCIALREPSLGPCMGVKGGATGGGYSQVVPSDDINLHFTGDFHAVTAAHNLLSSVLDNHLHFGNKLNINPLRVLWRRVIDMNDRSLRNVMVGMGGIGQGIPRETGFDITASSEIMAMLCLATDVDDLRKRIDRTLIGFTHDKEPVTAGQLNVTGAMMALLKDAILPNLVQTLEGVPTLVHGGPFANIAHGCNSVIATQLATQLGDWAVTEAGFGFDLGGEKFFDIKCAGANMDVAAVVIVATIRALKMHGGAAIDELKKTDVRALAAGLPNLEKHIENAIQFGKQPVVAINKFHHDTQEEIDIILDFCRKKGVRVALSDHFARGGDGAIELAEAVVESAGENTAPFKPAYDWSQPVDEKIRAVAQKVYGASDVLFEKKAKRDLKDIARLGYDNLPICIAKTQNSISDDPKLLGRPSNFNVTVRRILINTGSGFLVVLTGNIMRMPGLPRKPQAENMDLVGEVVEGIA